MTETLKRLFTGYFKKDIIANFVAIDLHNSKLPDVSGVDYVLSVEEPDRTGPHDDIQQYGEPQWYYLGKYQSAAPSNDGFIVYKFEKDDLTNTPQIKSKNFTGANLKITLYKVQNEIEFKDTKDAKRTTFGTETSSPKCIFYESESPFELILPRSRIGGSRRSRGQSRKNMRCTKRRRQTNPKQTKRKKAHRR